MRAYKLEQGLIGKIADADDGRGQYSAGYVQLFLDRENNRVWGVYHYSIGRNEVTSYDRNPEIISVGNYAGKITRNDLMAEINRRQDMIEMQEDMATGAAMMATV